MVKHYIETVAGVTRHIVLRLTNQDGTPATAADYAIYGAARQGDHIHPFAAAPMDPSSVRLSIPPLEASNYAYDLYAKHTATGVEHALLCGSIRVADRVASMPPADCGGERIEAVLSADRTDITVTVQIVPVITAATWEAIEGSIATADSLLETASNLLPEARREISTATTSAKQAITTHADVATDSARSDITTAADQAVLDAVESIAATAQTVATAIRREGDNVTDSARIAINDAAATAAEQGIASLSAITASGKADLSTATTVGSQAVAAAATSGKSEIQAAVTAGTGTIQGAVSSGKASIDSYVSANQADIPRKSQPNIWSGVQTFNAPVVINAAATLTTATYAPSALINCDTMLALTYVAQAIQCGYYSAFDSTSYSLNALAFTGVTATPSATAYAVRPMYGQAHGDANNRYVTIRAEFGDNMCVHFGGGRNTPSGVVRMQAPCVLHTDLPPGSDSPYYDHEPQYFAVVGKGYCANAQPVLLLYHRASDEILYAEALMPAAKSCTISTHYIGGVAGKYYDQIYDIYSGRTGYVDTSTRTRITLVGRGKFQMTGGGAVVSSTANNAGRACVRTWPMIAPSEAQVAVIRAHTLAAAYSSVRTKPVTCDLPDTCAVAAEGGVITGTATSVNAWPADYLAAYVVRLADWVSIRTVSDATQSSPAVTRIIGSGTITLTISPNTTGAPRSACVLVGAPACPARIITINQSAS